MKKTLPILSFLLFTILLSTQSYSQCYFSVDGVSVTVGAQDENNLCVVKLDLTFAIDRNNGNKRVYIHLWEKDKFPADFPQCGALTRVPTTADLTGANQALTTVVIDPQVAAGAILGDYTCAEGEIVADPATTTLTRTSGPTLDTFKISNLEIKLPGVCNFDQIVSLRGVAWSTQAGNFCNLNGGCTTTCIEIQLNDPTVLDFSLNCGTDEVPNTFNLGITSISPIPYNVAYKIYGDANGDGIPQESELLITSDPFAISATMSPKLFVTMPYPQPDLASRNYDLIVVVDNTDPLTPDLAPRTAIAKNGCNILPVSLVNFEGRSAGTSNILTWTTASETNVKSFEIEKSPTGAGFIKAASLNSKSVAGSSSQALNYETTDRNPYNVTFYRLKIVDKDGNFEYSPVISVRASNAVNRIAVYPNPGKGIFNITGASGVNFNTAVKLYSTTGQNVPFVVTNQNESSGSATVSMRSAVPGIYFLEINTPNGKKVERLVVN